MGSMPSALGDIARTFFRKALKSVRLRGVWGSLRHGAERLLRHGQNIRPVAVDDTTGRHFDETYGVDTCQASDPGWLGRLGGSNWVHGQAYSPAPIGLVNQALAQLPAEFQHGTFIDVGSGKGRIVLLASSFPFCRVLGVEYDRLLHDIALRNVAAFNSSEKEKIELYCADATEFELPPGPLVLFFHHPFDRPLFEVICRRLEATWQQSRQAICVIYIDPKCGDVFAASPSFELCSELQGEVPYAIYRTPKRRV
jgi:hypothetical protein